MDAEAIEWMNQRVYDKRHFTARYIGYLSETTGMQPDAVAKGFAGLVVCILALSHEAHVFANGLLVIVPILLTFVYVDEKPTDESLNVYWTVFGISVVLDRVLEKIPLYYVVKLALFLLLVLPPFRFINKAEELLRSLQDGDKQNSKRLSSTLQKSDKRTLSESSTQRSAVTGAAPLSTSGRGGGGVGGVEKPSEAPAALAVPAPVIEPVPAVVDVDSKVQAAEGSDQAAAAAGAANPTATGNGETQNPAAQPSTSTSDMPGTQRFRGANPMESSSFYKLTSSTSTEGIDTKGAGPLNNLHDMLFFPMNKLVFNAPFDYENLTYHMRIVNNSHHRLAFAIKGNSVPRIMAYPPYGILELKEKRYIAVTVQNFKWNEFDYNKDRIAFDYVLLSDTQKDVKKFDLSLFQQSDAKRRKNIIIEYNP